jgi:serine/threonine-protein kinase
MDNASQSPTSSGGASHPAAAGPPDLTGRTLGEFKVLRRLGQGGMGQVYVAEQTSLKRHVALKILRTDLAANPTALARFKAEAEAVARATHANIVQVYHIGESDGLHYMALEYVEGRNLKDYVSRKGALEALTALSIMRQVASALQRASELGIIHRDIKPENILLNRKGEAKVADFGLSRVLDDERRPVNLTQSGVTMGTPLYMSPEQVQGQTLDARTDIYSFGVTCYHVLAGEPPFKGKTPFEVALQHVNAQPEPLPSVRPDLPPDLCAVVHKMMAKDPGQRYQTCRDLLKDLAHVREALANGADGPQTGVLSLDSVAGLTPPPAAPSKSGVRLVAPPARRPWKAWLAVGSVLLALAGGVAAAWLPRFEQERAAPPATPPEGSPGDTFRTLPEQEQEMKRTFDRYANPGKDAERVRLGVGHAVELLLSYLDEWRLDDADAFSDRLEKLGAEVRPYRNLGRLGNAIVAALRSKPAESDAQFQDLLGEKRERERGELIGFLNANPKLRRWVATAVDYNAANAPLAPFPDDLNYLRQPGRFLSPPPPKPPKGG